jgi:putative NIF3 family GTP cyclohydrolase 1 type 2
VPLPAQELKPTGMDMNRSRRNFLLQIGALAIPVGAIAHRKASYTVRQVIELILKSIPGAPFPSTVDTIKAGSIDQQVTGIVTTMFATVDVIRQAAKSGANFIIAHEPTYYNHLDESTGLEHDNVYQQKIDLLKKYQIVVWRFHDYMHSLEPDGVFMGVLEALGWTKYYDQSHRGLLNIEPTSLSSIIKLTKSGLNIEHIRFIGNEDQVCRRVLLIPGAAGGKTQITGLQDYRPDLLIVGELNEWETSEYIRDMRALGMNTSLIVLGHIQSEEPGMKWLVKWLQQQLKGIKVTHFPSLDAFSWK